jgi:SAM-dependent methyltransferase
MGRPGVAAAVRAIGRSALLGHNVLAGGAGAALRARRVRTTLALFESVRLAGLPRGKDSKVLDVGSGSGALVYALSLTGLATVTGIDPFNDDDRTFDTGARVLKQDLGDLDDDYDLIMLHHAFEHVPEPRETMRQVRDRLRRGGRALIRMPTVSSAAYARYGRDWMQLDPPRHLTLFSRLGMERLCADTGMRLVRVSDDSTAFQFWASEQIIAGTPLVSETSHFLHPERSAFTTAQIRRWEHEAARLNRQHRGDQSCWVVSPA